MDNDLNVGLLKKKKKKSAYINISLHEIIINSDIFIVTYNSQISKDMHDHPWENPPIS